MDWAGWVYWIGFVITAGAAIAVVVRNGDSVSEKWFGIAVCSTLWIVVWCAVVAHCILDRSKKQP